MKKRTEMMAAVLQSPGLQRAIERSSRAGEGDEKTLQERARQYLLEIAADYDEQWLNIWEKVLSRLWRIIYDDFVVDQRGLEKIREISRKMPFVIVPCHRSHLDYLIISYILYRHGVPLPFVAAGDNMNFWPLGYIFRQSGAFFLRRSFQGNDLYADVFTAYVETLLREGVSIEFFVEGGRSRTGKMLMPKYGMVSMLVRAYQERVCDDLAFIPVYIGYDRIVEENAYLKELQGVSKRRESMLDVIKHSKIMMRRYGRVYVNFGNPLFLKSALRQKSFTGIAGDDKQLLYRNIGHAVVSEINRVSVATPASLVAASLLCHNGEEIRGDLLRATFTLLYDYLSYRKVNFAPALAAREEAVPAVLELFSRRGFLLPKSVRKEKKGFAGLYLLPDDKRLNLEYYKNTLIHHFLSLGLAALSVLSRREKEIAYSSIKDDCIFLKMLFREEFIWGGDEDIEITESLAYLEEQGVITGAEGNVVGKNDRAKEVLGTFSGLLRSYLESYWVVLNACSPDENKLAGGKNGLPYIRQWAYEMYKRGDIKRAESISDANYNNALKFLRGEGIINYGSPSGKGTGDGRFQVADERRLESLRLRLSNFM
ncbi:MAG TPA: 1-acyl-sn-glycerol-3-phosphate acyltransferase [Syntrophales bacterium]|nr:1-acyl-sn-glycerol-3-phosphate acyltransferase [Syntrophales bacterium]